MPAAQPPAPSPPSPRPTHTHPPGPLRLHPPPPPSRPHHHAAMTVSATTSRSFRAGFHAPCDSVPPPSLSDKQSRTGEGETAGPGFSLADEFPKAAAVGSDATPDWSELPTDLLVRVVQHLELPVALAFGAVCPSWRSASMAAGIAQACRPPWLVSLAKERSVHRELSWDPAVISKFRSLLNAETIIEVSFPKGQVVACCGASHGWLIVANELSDLVLYNPFTSVLIPLPPITGFTACVKGVYGDEGNIMGYRYGRFVAGEQVYNLMSLGAYFYDKVVLSGSPSRGGTIALAIYMDSKRLSFARVGESCWQDASVIRRTEDSYADCVYHDGRFYTVTMEGVVKSWDLSGPDKPKKKVIVSEKMEDNYLVDVITRYLVPTPWGHLLQVRVILDMERANRVRVEIYKLDLKRHKMVKLRSATALRGHAAFVGQNSSGCLPAERFLELKPDSIYFTTPRLREHNVFDLRCNEWKGVKIYDLKKRKLETAFLSGGGKYGTKYPSEVWFMPNL